MRLFFLLLLIFEFNFSYTITPWDIEQSLKIASVDSFKEVKIRDCRVLKSNQEKWQKPFYFRYKEDSTVMWFSVSGVYLKPGTLFASPIFQLFDKQWSDDKNNWLIPNHSSQCATDLDFKENFLINYLEVPYKLSEGTNRYISVQNKTNFDHIVFFVKEAREQIDLKSLATDEDLKHSSHRSLIAETQL